MPSSHTLCDNIKCVRKGFNCLMSKKNLKMRVKFQDFSQNNGNQNFIKAYKIVSLSNFRYDYPSISLITIFFFFNKHSN